VACTGYSKELQGIMEAANALVNQNYDIKSDNYEIKVEIMR